MGVTLREKTELAAISFRMWLKCGLINGGLNNT